MSEKYGPGYHEWVPPKSVRKRGRKSAEALSTSVISIVPGKRPEPPEELTPEQAETWRATVGRMPVGWATPELWPMICQLCRHTSLMKFLGGQLEAFDPRLLQDAKGFRRFEKLVAMHEKEGRALTSLLTRLRLTPHSRYDKHRANTAVEGRRKPKPWETGGE